MTITSNQTANLMLWNAQKKQNEVCFLFQIEFLLVLTEFNINFNEEEV